MSSPTLSQPELGDLSLEKELPRSQFMSRSLGESPMLRKVASALLAAGGMFGLSGCGDGDRDVDDAFVSCVYDKGGLDQLELDEDDPDSALDYVRDDADCDRDPGSHGYYMFVHTGGGSYYSPSPSRLSPSEVSAARSSGLMFKPNPGRPVRSQIQDRVSGLRTGAVRGNASKIPSTVRGGFGSKFGGGSGFSGGARGGGS